MFYVRVATRGGPRPGKESRARPSTTLPAATTPREPGYRTARLAYIARMDPGMEDRSRRGARSVDRLRPARGGDATRRKCGGVRERRVVPTDRCATAGYKSITFTLPKEVSLFAEGHREEGQRGDVRRGRRSARTGIPGMAYTAVAAIHTRNEAGEIHYHVHVLVGIRPRARDAAASSLQRQARRERPSRVQDLKVGWKESVERIPGAPQSDNRAARSECGPGAGDAGRESARTAEPGRPPSTRKGHRALVLRAR